MKKLDQMVQENSTDYYEAIVCALDAAGGDETAVNSWMHAAAEKENAAAMRWETSQQLSSVAPDQLMAQSSKNAYQKLVKIARQGYVPAMLDVAACLRMGIGTAKDETAAHKQLIDACKGGDIKARFQWLLYTDRISTWADKDRPEVASEVERGNHYVIQHLSGRSPDAATQVEWMKNAAGKGSGDAYLALSSLASANHPKESITLLRVAAHLHHPEAIYVLATVLADTGSPTEFQKQADITPDEAESLKLMKTAALLGSLRATMALGSAYYNGTNGLPQDYKKAYFHFSNPLVAGNPAAMTSRALMLLQGQGVKKDTAAALKMLQDASKVYAPAGISLAWATYKGIGKKANAKEAADQLMEIGAAGASAAYVYLAYIYAKGGPGVQEDISQAKRYVRLASLDMEDAAQKLYDTLIVEGWTPQP